MRVVTDVQEVKLKRGISSRFNVWRKMLDKKIIPTKFTYNLLLRCTRDCSIGNINRFKEDLASFLPPSQQELLDLSPVKNAIESTDMFIEENNYHLIWKEKNDTPNLLQQQPILNSTIYLTKIIKPWHRLLLLGGQEGFINMMMKSGAEPDIKTITLLLFTIAPNVHGEELLIRKMKSIGIKMDLDFCNMLIKKRNIYSNYRGANEVLTIIREEQLVPNIITFGVLAMGCTKLKHIKLLLRDMKAVGFRLNIEILGTLLHSACRSWDFKAVHFLVQLLIKNEIKPNYMFIEHLQKLDELITKHCERRKRGVSHCNRLESKNFEEEYENFKECVTYIKTLEVDDPITRHPWSQFRKHEVE